jgi:hypothetical protein
VWLHRAQRCEPLRGVSRAQGTAPTPTSPGWILAPACPIIVGSASFGGGGAAHTEPGAAVGWRSGFLTFRHPRCLITYMVTPAYRRSRDSMSALVGTAVPAVTRTFSTFDTWFTDVPRTWRTPSAMPFMPWI